MPSIQQEHAACLLHHAVSAEDIERVAALLRDGADPNIHVQDSHTTLALAAYRGQLDMVRLLLAHGAEVRPGSDCGYTVFYTACAGRNLSIVQELLTAGANINERCKDGRTALGMLAYNGDVEILKMIIRAGASLDMRDINGLAAIHHAAAMGHISALQELVLAGSSHTWRTNKLRTPLALACIGGHSRCVNYLLDECSADPGVVDAGGHAPLLLAGENGNISVVEALVRFDDRQLGPNAYPGALVRAVVCRADSVLKVLLSADGRMHVNSRGKDIPYSLLHYSAGCCNPIATSMLLGAGADENAVDCNGELPFDVVDVFKHTPHILRIFGDGYKPSSRGLVGQRRVRLMLKQAPAYRARSWRWPNALPACALSPTTAPATSPAQPAHGKTRETTTKDQVEPPEMRPEDLEDACDIAMAAMATNAMLQKLGVRVFRRPPITLGGSTIDGHPMVVSGLIRYAE